MDLLSQQDIDELKQQVKNLSDKLTTVSRKLDEQQATFETNFLILATSVEAMSIIRYYASRAENMTADELESGVISCLERLEGIRSSTQLPNMQSLAMEKQQFIFGALLDLAKRKNILPGEVLVMLKEKLGQHGVEATVDLDDVTRVFGSIEATNWRTLLNEEV